MTETTPREVAVVGFGRTPFGRFGGALRSVPHPALGAVAARHALAHASTRPEEVEEVVVGVNFPGADRSIARQTALQAGIPDDRNALTVDRACCSSLTAMTVLSRPLRLGEAGCGLAGGVDNLSRVPYFLEDMRWGNRLGHVQLSDQLVVSCPHTGVPRAIQAADEAAAYGVGRGEQDEWALRSQQRYEEARRAGAFREELAPVDIDVEGQRVVLTEDEVPRPDTSLEGLAELPTVNGSTTVTAGNAPDLSGGASMVVLATQPWSRRHGRPVLATLEGFAMASGEPSRIASMPAEAARRALARAGIGLDDVDVLEINEAFAAVPLVTTLELAERDAARAAKLRRRTNVRGGAVAVGHPTGATAARLVISAVQILRERGGGTGLVTLCGGIGEAEAVVVRAW